MAACGYVTAASPCASLSVSSPWSSRATSDQACGSGGGRPALPTKLLAACTPLEESTPGRLRQHAHTDGQDTVIAHRAICCDAAHVDPRLKPYFRGLRSTKQSLAPVQLENTKTYYMSRCPRAHAPALGTPGRRTSSACRCGRRAQSEAKQALVRALGLRITGLELVSTGTPIESRSRARSADQ